MADIEKIAEDLSNLTVLEAAELAKLLEGRQVGCIRRRCSGRHGHACRWR